MNLHLLPKQLQDLISEFNVEHRPIMRVVMDELNHYWIWRNENDKECDVCGNKAKEEYSINILWEKYHFCGEYCRYEREYYLRKSYREYEKRTKIQR